VAAAERNSPEDPPLFWRLLRQSWRFFLLFTLAALALRLFFFFRFAHVTGDSLIYGDIARNWLDHGVFGMTHADGPHPTWIRLPGYPAFVAACFLLFGREHYNAILLAQIAIDVAGCCFFVADLARRTLSERAARWAFVVAALCPFTANYAVAPLAETLSIFFTVVALDCAVAGFDALDARRGGWPAWCWCGVALAAGILLRPDGGLLLVAIGLFLLWRMWKRPAQRAQLFWAGVLLLAVALAPLVPWTMRNWRDFHHFQPLAPRYASDPDEPSYLGFQRWMRTWILDYVSTEEVYWQIPGDDVDVANLPSRAFDTPQQREATLALFRDYARTRTIDLPMDARFAELAAERVRAHPLRYYLWLPLARAADMWIRPRTEMLPLNSRWWEYNDDLSDCLVATAWDALNLLFLLAAALGIVRGPRPRYLALMLLFLVLRSSFLGSLENPEPRYTLECYPVIFVLAAGWLSSLRRRALPSS
jgi:4-amino-4-deoxy-L-arabinose transferase-like glycosyltransferase